MNRNDNHGLRRLGSTAPHVPETIDHAFEAWRASRPDRARFAEGGYPVYFVCAEGGGIYAAHFTAQVLATLQDADPRFASHTFVISGVSGGSVGAATFVALAAEFGAGRMPAGGTYASLSKSVLSADYLSPVLAMGLFPDALQRFIPAPAFGLLDRARGIEYAYEMAWERATGTRRAETSFYRLWTASGVRGEGDPPRLFLNTTEVETGRRVPIAPNPTLAGPQYGQLITLNDPSKAPGLDLAVSTAAFASARFPYVTPVASVEMQDHRSRLGDGGYFENHGAATLLDLIEGLDVLPGGTRAEGLRICVIRIGTRIGSSLETAQRAKYNNGWMGESLSPLRTLFNTRGARGELAVIRLRQRVEAAGGAFHEVLLDTEVSRLPLGWLLSEAARERIEMQVGRPVFSDTLVTPPVGPYDNSVVLGQILGEIGWRGP
jgi:hypothetical protein